MKKYILFILLISVGCIMPARRNEDSKSSNMRDCSKACDGTNMKDYEDDISKCKCYDKVRED